MTQVLTGSFINAASTPQFVPIVGQINEFRLKNLTLSGVTAGGISGSLTSDRIVEAFFSNYMSAGWAQVIENGTVAGSLAPMQNGALSSNGFYLFNAANQAKGANIAVASFVPGSPTVFTTSAPHGFIVGDNVRIVSMTSAPELGGLVMTVTAVGGGGTTFTTLLDSTNSLTSVGTVFKVGNANLPSFSSLYYPEWRAVASITLANPMVVTLLVRQNYQIGDKVRFNIPQGPTVSGTHGYGMPEINSTTNGLPLTFTVIAVNNAIGTQTVTLAVDSTAFTAFAWPGTGFYPIGLPVMIPEGEGNINNFSSFGISPNPLPYANQDILGFATQNQAQNGILIGAGDGAVGASTPSIIGATVDFWQWECVTSLQTYP